MNMDSFNNYIDSYKKLSLKDKKLMLEREIKEILALLTKLHEDKNQQNEIIINKEILDIKNGVSSEEDFVEAMFVYILSIQESLASYIKIAEDI